MAIQAKKFSSGESSILYRLTGSGPAVMLVHGFGEGGFVWQSVAEEISGYTLIIPDLPGSGESEAVQDMSMEGLADVLAGILDRESLESCILIGHSMGGYIALAFAEKYPGRLKGLGLFHSTAYADTAEKIETREKGIRFIEENGAASFLETTIPNLYAPETKVKNDKLIANHIEKVRNFSGAALVSYYRSMIARPDRTHVLRHTGVPVLFIAGKYDTAVPYGDIMEQAQMPEISYFHVLDRSGHMGMFEERSESVKMVKKFIDETAKHHQSQ